MKKSLSLLLAFAMVFTMFSSLALAETAETVSAELDAAAKFEALVEKEIFSGFEDGSARLDEDMTRAQAAVIVSLLFQLDISNPPATPSFKDLPATHWAYDFVEAATAAGIISGHGDGTFEPGVTKDGEIVSGQVTIEQLATMLVIGFVNEFGYEIDEDATVEGASGWAQKYVAAAVELGFLSESDDYTANASRELLVEAVYEAEALAAIEIPIRDLAIEEIVINSASEIEVTFSNEDVATYELDPALEANTATEVTIVHEGTGKVFTVTLTLEVNAEVDSAAALTDKLVQVKLTEEVGAVSAAEFSIKDVDGETVAVNGASLVDGKTVELTTGELETGQLYLLTVGSKTVEFAGIDKDDSTPTFTVSSENNTTLKVTFNVPVEASAASFSVKESYGSQELDVTNVKVSADRKSVVLTTDSQKTVLYTVTVDGYQSLFGKSGTQKTATVVGKAISDAKLTVAGVETRTDTLIIVEFGGENPDTDLATNIANFKIEEAYGSKEIEVTSAAMVKDAPKKVALTLSDKLDATKLYKVTVSGVTTVYGYELDKDNASRTFVGSPQVSVKNKLGISGISPSNNTTIVVTFTGLVDADLASNIANYEIERVYGDQELTVTKAEVKNNDPLFNNQAQVHLTTDAMTTDLYRLTLKGLADLFGNGLVDNPTATFVGKAVGAKPAINQAIMNGDGKLVVTFNEALQSAAATKISNYYIKDLGYPSKASLSGRVVTLTIPKAKADKIYTLEVLNMVNSDGVVQDSKLTRNFVGTVPAAASELPVVEGVVAIDKQTIAVYFNQDVTGNNLKGATKLYDAGKIRDVADLLKFKKGDTVTDLRDTNVYTDSSNKNVLYVRSATAHFGGSDQMTLIISSSLVKGDSDQEVPFAPNNSDPIKPSVVAAAADNNRTVTVYFNTPVDFDVTDFVLKAENGDPIANPFINDFEENATMYKFITRANLELTLQKYTLEIAGDKLTDITGIVDGGSDPIKVEFAGNSSDPGEITNIAAQALNKRTIVVYFPEPMDSTDVKVRTHYTIPGLTGWNAITDIYDGITYDPDTNSATIYLTRDLGSGDNGKYIIEIGDTLANKYGTKTVKENTKVEFATNTSNPPAPAIKSVANAVYDAISGNYTVKVTFDMPITVENSAVALFEVTDKNGVEHAALSATVNADNIEFVVGSSFAGGLSTIVIENDGVNVLRSTRTNQSLGNAKLEFQAIINLP